MVMLVNVESDEQQLMLGEMCGSRFARDDS